MYKQLPRHVVVVVRAPRHAEPLHEWYTALPARLGAIVAGGAGREEGELTIFYIVIILLLLYIILLYI